MSSPLVEGAGKSIDILEGAFKGLLTIIASLLILAAVSIGGCSYLLWS